MALHDRSQPGQGVHLDLSDPFPGHADFLADLLEGALVVTVQTEAALHHGPLLLVQAVQPFFQYIVNVLGLDL